MMHKCRMSLPSLMESPNGWGAAIGLLAAGVFFTFVAWGNPEQGKVAAFSFVAISGLVGFHWLHRTEAWFCGLVALFAVLHVALIAALDWQFERGPALLIFGPAAILDFVAMTLVVTSVARWCR